MMLSSSSADAGLFSPSGKRNRQKLWMWLSAPRLAPRVSKRSGASSRNRRNAVGLPKCVSFS
jgi:hypothetical protein